VYRFSVRLAGIDTPEIHGSTSSEKASAIAVRDLLANLVLNKIVLLKNVHFEKYGRLLADVYLGDLHLNKHLLDNHCAVPYHGGKKEKYVNVLRNDV
jgi:endonuclease YncB( thermonuclease family)